MRTKVFALAAVLVLMLVLAAPVGAVQFGVPDGNGHPYVGLVVFFKGDMPLWRCTGTLISPTVFLTAGHCTGIDPALGYGPDHAEVWFAPGLIPRGNLPQGGTSCTGFTGYPCKGDVGGTPHPHPLWNGYLTIPNTHDVGYVALSTPVTNRGFGTVAPVGYLDSLATRRGLQNTEFTVVGYGLQSVKPVSSGLRERFVGTVSLVNLRSHLTDGYNVQQSSDPGLGNGPGGTCFGDSGGPVFHTSGGQTVIVAVNSFVLNLNCRGAGFGFRMDTQLVHDFLPH